MSRQPDPDDTRPMRQRMLDGALCTADDQELWGAGRPITIGDTMWPEP